MNSASHRQSAGDTRWSEEPSGNGHTQNKAQPAGDPAETRLCAARTCKQCRKAVRAAIQGRRHPELSGHVPAKLPMCFASKASLQLTLNCHDKRLSDDD